MRESYPRYARLIGFDTPLMRESIPSICVEIERIQQLWAVDAFRLIFAYAGFHVPRTGKLEARCGPVQGLSGEHPGARRVCTSPADRCQVSAL
jgi:hypothetical protein